MECQSLRPLRLRRGRSASWGGSAALPPDLFHPPDAKAEAEAEAGTDADATSQLPPNAASDRNRLINRIRHGADMKLDMDALKDNHDSSLDGDAELQLRRERLAACNKVCSCILPYLFVSGQAVAQNLSTLQDSRITHIINCVGFVCPEYFPDKFTYRTLWLHDSPCEDIMCILYDVFDYIEEVREQSGGRVLLHCSEGVSRSPVLAIAYLMWRRNESFEDAFEEVKSKRDVVSPNMGFVGQLMQLQKKISASPDKEARQIYFIAPQSQHDPLYLVPKSMGSWGIDVLDSRGAFVIRFNNMLYIWKGRQCDEDMAAVADNAAFQLIRYERAKGPCMLVSEGSEGTDIPQVWAELCETHEVQVEKADGKHVALYDSDFEVYRKAKMGTHVRPGFAEGP